MHKVRLKIPSPNELEYRRYLIADSATMEYNIGYGNHGKGCYSQSAEQVQKWYENWNNGSGNYYAYIIRQEDNVPIGEVDIHWSGCCNKHIVGIVLEAKHRGKGYAEEALTLLCQVAFQDLQLDKIYDDFPPAREAAEKVFAKIGFIREDENFVVLTKERYKQICKNLNLAE